MSRPRKVLFVVGGFIGFLICLLGQTWLMHSSAGSKHMGAENDIIEVGRDISDPVRLNATKLKLLKMLSDINNKLSRMEISHQSFQPANQQNPINVETSDSSTVINAVSSWNSGDNVGITEDQLPAITVNAVDCDALFQGDPAEQSRATKFQRLNPKAPISAQKYVELTQKCSHFVAQRKYITVPVNMEEAEFPLAYSILMFKDVEQFERLLRAIYRPQNLYCIHVDLKSPSSVHDAVKSIAGCFENVFVLSQSHDVRWGTFTILQPELDCMTQLLSRSKKWKYFINLTGQEFPLKTNWQIVQILKAFNNSNNMEGTVKRRNVDRVEGQPSPPVNVTLTKGSVHIAATRKFVDFIIYNETAIRFLDWVKQTRIPDETFFSSLNHSPQLEVPGSYIGKPETDQDRYRFLVRFKNWGDGPFNWPCHGKRVSMVCILSVGDLPLLASRPELFANKFYLEYEPLALDCMEKLHVERVREELNSASPPAFDTSLYERQLFVQNHI